MIKTVPPRILMYPVTSGSGISTYSKCLRNALGGCVALRFVEEKKNNSVSEANENGKIRFRTLRLTAGYLKEFLEKYRMFRKLRDDTDILHLNNMGAEVDAIAARCAGIKNIVGTLHVLPGTYRESLRLGYRVLEWLSLKSASSLIAISEAVADQWSKRTGISRRRFRVIYNGIDFDARDAGLKKTIQIPDTKEFVIGVSDRLHPLKGHDSLIKAVSHLPKEVKSNVTLMIIGEGKNRSVLKDLSNDLGVSDHVVFAGYVDDVYPYLKECDLFMSGSRYEGMSYSIAEAMGCGIPCVVTDVGGMSEIIRLSYGGKVVRVDDVQAMTDAIVKYYNDAEARNETGEKGKWFAERELNSIKMARNTIDVYNQHLDEQLMLTIGCSGMGMSCEKEGNRPFRNI